MTKNVNDYAKNFIAIDALLVGKAWFYLEKTMQKFAQFWGLGGRKMIYYSHSMQKYGTKEEKEELNLIRKYFNSWFFQKKIFNPNCQKIQRATDPMSDCLCVVQRSEAVVFSTFKGHIGKGVWREIETARRHNIPVYRIQEGKIIKFTGRLSVIDRNWHTHFAIIT